MVTRNNVLYIGSNISILIDLIQMPKSNMDFYHIKTPEKAYTWYQSSGCRPNLILIDDDCVGLDVLGLCSLIKQRFGKNNNMRFILFSDTPNSYKIKRVAQYNVVEIFPKKLRTVQRERLYSIMSNEKVFTKEKKQDLKIDRMKESKIPFWKRAFDITFAFVALILLLPILLVVVICIKVESSGPIFYISKRVGKGFNVFDFYKFRTMSVGADKELDVLKGKLNQYTSPNKKENLDSCGCDHKYDCVTLIIDSKEICETVFLNSKRTEDTTFVKIKNDPRVTKFGRFLRNTSIDELPQLLNILKGDMSIVGNRPLPFYEAEKLTTDQSVQRFLAPAGLTGLWQVNKRGKGNMSNEERTDLDNKYAQEWSFWMDMRLIFKTLGVFVQRENV